MIKKEFFAIASNKKIALNTYEMILVGNVDGIIPGQFVNIKLDGFFLRRPISVCDVYANRLVIIYKTVGEGTERMSRLKSGTLDLLTCLGNGYDMSKSGKSPILVGGGVGVPPMYYLAKSLTLQNKNVTVIMGFNTQNEIFYVDEIKQIGANVLVTTIDGSYGTKGYVTDEMARQKYTYFYACGPEPMLRAVYNTSVTDGEMSFEERMGCGFGACMGCSCKTITGYKRICKDGPVMKKEEILWA